MINFNEMEGGLCYEKQLYHFDLLANLCKIYGSGVRRRFDDNLVKEYYWKIREFFCMGPTQLSLKDKNRILTRACSMVVLNESYFNDVVYPEESLSKAIENNLGDGIDELIVGLSKYCLVHDDFLPAEDILTESAKSKVKITNVFEGFSHMFKCDAHRRRGLLYLPIYNDITGKLDIVPKVYENF